MPNVQPTNSPEQGWAMRALSTVQEDFDIVFQEAPIAIHGFDKDLKIVRVNSRWLQILEFESNEVLGRNATDFMTEESRARVVTDVLPLLLRYGTVRSIGTQYVRKDGQVIDALLDAEVSPAASGDIHAYAVLRDGNDRTQWEQASATIRVLQELTRLQRKIEDASFLEKGDKLVESVPTARHLSGGRKELGLAAQTIGTLLESLQDISASLRSLVRLQEVQLDTTADQQMELLLTAKNIGRALAEISDAIATRQISD